MLQNILFPLYSEFKEEYQSCLHYGFVALILGLFGGVFIVEVLEPSRKVFYSFWAAGVFFGHFQYYIIKKQHLDKIDIPEVYLWMAWTPLSIVMIMQTFTMLFLYIVIAAFKFVNSCYKKQLHKILKID